MTSFCREGIRLAAGVAGAFVLAASLGTAPAGAALRPEVRTLENGLEVAVFHDTRLPVVQCLLMVPAGSACEERGQAGAAHLVAELVRHGTTSRDAVAYAGDVDRLGGNVTTSAGRDYALISGAFLARDFDEGLELLSDAAVNPVFPEDEFEKVREARMSAVGQQLLDAGQTADDLLWATVFAGSPYARPPLGKLAGLDVIGIDSLRAFYREHWTPDHAVLAVAGDVPPESAFAAVRERFGAWQRRPPREPERSAASAQPRIRILDRPELTQVELRIGFPGPRRGDADEIPLTLASQLLSGSDSSRWARLSAGSSGLRRPRGFSVALRDGGLFWVAASAAIDSAGTAVRALRAELDELRNKPPDEAELAPTRRLVRAGVLLNLETLGALVLQWSGAALYGLPEGEAGSLAERTDSTRASALAAALRRWADPARASIVAVGPAAKLRPQLEGLGPVEVVTADVMTGRSEEEMPQLPAFSAVEQKQGREIMRKLIAAHGGLPALRGVHDSSVEADLTLTAGAQSVSGQFVQIRKEPYRMAVATTFAGFASRQVLEDHRGWMTSSTGGRQVQETDSMGVAGLRSSFRSDVPHVLVAAAAPESRVGDLGRDWLDGRAVEKLEVRDPADVRRILYVDASSQRLVGMDFNEDPTARSSFGSRRIYRNYRTVSGVLWPFEEERWLNGERVMFLDYTRVDLNKGVADAAFARPEQAPPPPSR